MKEDPRPIFLIGFSGVGKTTIARHLAEISGRKYVDTDAYIEKKYHSSISDMFACCGVDKFRKRETVILIELSLYKDLIIATGGGMPCSDENIGIMRSRGTVVYLYSNIDSLTERLEICKATRPLVAHLDKEGIRKYVEETLPKREPYYSRAHYTVDVSGMMTVEDEKRIAQDIYSLLTKGEQ
ncbi:shikimate kinase [Porphyromonas sp.]|uniref:shikimate kinase n=1 Tax=Porphyromonas sp. TaxID=1924944 RepID=UPI0026DA7A6B|nr:shikimate kinase [Porphyromonas sp.]MDO4771283.1 shikimate kinase [Porphyromonas sp.]